MIPAPVGTNVTPHSITARTVGLRVTDNENHASTFRYMSPGEARQLAGALLATADLMES